MDSQPAYTPAARQVQGASEQLTPVETFSSGLHVDGRRAIGGPGAVCCDAFKRVSIKPFQSQVFVAVSDLSTPGRGQVSFTT